MSEAHREHVLRLQAKVDTMSGLLTHLKRSMRDIQLAASARGDTVSSLSAVCDDVREVIAGASKSASLANFGVESASVLFDALMEIDKIVIKYSIAAKESLAVDQGTFTTLKNLGDGVEADITSSIAQISTAERMIEDPSLADEKTRRQIGKHPEKIRDKRAFNALDAAQEAEK